VEGQSKTHYGDPEPMTTNSFTPPADILLVDDDEQWARVTSQLLEATEPTFDITIANSYTEGKQLFEEHDPECILCDYQLGDDTGLTLLEDVRSVDENRPFLLITGRGDEILASEAIKKGVSDYLPKDHDDEQAIVLANRLRTIIKESRASRQLERERNAKATAVEVLTATSTASDFLEQFCKVIVDYHEYAGAWIGTKTASGTVVPQIAIGCDEYLETVLSEQGGDSSIHDPAIEALHSNELTTSSFLSPNQDNQELSDEQYKIARKHGYRAAIGVPICYEAVQFGVLGIYTSHPDIPDQEQDTLKEFTELLGYAQQRDELRQSLISSESVPVEITIADTNIPLVQLARKVESDEISVVSVVERSDGQTVYIIRVEDRSEKEVIAAIKNCDRIECSKSRQRSSSTYCTIVVNSRTPEILIGDTGINHRETQVSTDQLTASGTISNPSSLKNVVTTLEEVYNNVTASIVWSKSMPDTTDVEGDKQLLKQLTDRQKEVLTHAYHAGYFEIPRGSSATELSEHLDVARATFTQHLRSGQRKIFKQIL